MAGDFMSSPYRRSRTISEMSSTMSCVVALDEQLLKRQVNDRNIFLCYKDCRFSEGFYNAYALNIT